MLLRFHWISFYCLTLSGPPQREAVGGFYSAVWHKPPRPLWTGFCTYSRRKWKHVVSIFLQIKHRMYNECHVENATWRISLRDQLWTSRRMTGSLCVHSMVPPLSLSLLLLQPFLYIRSCWRNLRQLEVQTQRSCRYKRRVQFTATDSNTLAAFTWAL